MQDMTEAESFVRFLLDRKEELDLPGLPPEIWSVESLSGNINRVRRVVLNYAGTLRSFVIKHVPAGGRLERYPTVVFPEDRLKFELAWFENASSTNHESTVRPPAVYARDRDNRTLVLEDFGTGPTITGLILTDAIKVQVLNNIGRFMASVHASSLQSKPVSNPSAERNRPFIFTAPLEQPDMIRQLWQKRYGRTNRQHFDLLVDLQERFLRKYACSVAPSMQELNRRFKTEKLSAFTHGDLHGQSLIVGREPTLGIIDAELADSGDPAFDIGTLLGHIWASTKSTGARPDKIQHYARFLWSGYAGQLERTGKVSVDDLGELALRVNQYSGCEILRRLIGAAGFPFEMSRQMSWDLAEDAVTLLLRPEQFNMALLNTPCSSTGLSGV